MSLRSLTPFPTSFTLPIATSGLKLYLDASRANGMSFPGTGTSYQNWVDLSGAGLWSGPTWAMGTGTNEGWYGSGTTSDPHCLNFVTTASSTITGNTNLGITGNGARTISCWVLDTTGETEDPGEFAGWGHIDGITGGLYYLTRSLAGNNKWGCWGYLADTPTTVLSADSNWHLIVAAFNGTTCIVYVDGVSKGSANNTYNTGDVFRIGKGVSASYATTINGKIAVIAVHNRALTGPEVTSFYNATKATFGY